MAKEIFSLSENFLNKFKDKKPPFGFDGVGEIAYMRSYSRVKENNINEQWHETVARVVNGTYNMQKRHIDEYGLRWIPQKAQRSAQEMYKRIFDMRFLPPGRGLFAMGSAITEERGLFASLNNCAFVSTENLHEDPAKPFTFLMDASMCGVGVGFDVRGEDIVLIKGIKEDRAAELFIIPDTREGWVESVGLLLESYFYGLRPIEFDYSEIRGAGEPIKGFGGFSGGSGPLKKLHAFLKNLLNEAMGEFLSATMITDIMNLIGVCVVSGGVRRCLPKGTLIHTEKGLIPIEKVVPGLKAYTSKGLHEISEMVCQGTQSVMSIRTQIGDFKCTKKHKIAVMIGPGEYKWKSAYQLMSGDRLVFPEHLVVGQKTELPKWKYEKPKKSTTCKNIIVPELDNDVAWFLGLFHGDGYVFTKQGKNINPYISIACSIDQEDIIERAEKIIKSFGVNVSRIRSKKEQCIRVCAMSKQLALYLSRFKKSSTTIDIPECILNGSSNIRAAYLAGLFDADGSWKNKPTTLVVSIYPDFLRQVQALYASLGVPVRFRQVRDEQYHDNWKALYCINLVGEIAIEKFEKMIAIHACEYQTTSKTKRSQNDFGFPFEMVYKLRRQLKDFHKHCNKKHKQVTYKTFQRLGGDTKGLIPIEVLDVEFDTDVVETYDITVPEALEFIAQEGLLVHNTAEIVFGDYRSDEYLDLKNYAVNPHRSEHGWASNNSVFADLGMDYEAVCDRSRINGEPGFAWLENMQKYSRMMNGPDNKDRRASGGNPCLEQTLESYELCCLVETFPDNHDSFEDYKKTLKFAYLYAKTVTLGGTHWPETNQVMIRNRRIGCSMSGLAQFITHRGIDELRDWTRNGYDIIQQYDEIYSDWLGIPLSKKTTSIKPSGTVSLLAGATPGMHYPESRYYIRRMELSINSPLRSPLEKANYSIVVSERDPLNTVLVEVPVDVGPGIRTAKERTMWEQISLAAFLQKYWADNQVSCTVAFDPEVEGPHLKYALDYFQYQLKGISFYPRTNMIKDKVESFVGMLGEINLKEESKHNQGRIKRILETAEKLDLKSELPYKQPPYEEIDEKRYKELSANLKPINFKGISGAAPVAVDKFCDGDMCEIPIVN